MVATEQVATKYNTNSLPFLALLTFMCARNDCGGVNYFWRDKKTARKSMSIAEEGCEGGVGRLRKGHGSQRGGCLGDSKYGTQVALHSNILSSPLCKPREGRRYVVTWNVASLQWQ